MRFEGTPSAGPLGVEQSAPEKPSVHEQRPTRHRPLPLQWPPGAAASARRRGGVPSGHESKRQSRPVHPRAHTHAPCAHSPCPEQSAASRQPPGSRERACSERGMARAGRTQSSTASRARARRPAPILCEVGRDQAEGGPLSLILAINGQGEQPVTDHQVWLLSLLPAVPRPHPDTARRRSSELARRAPCVRTIPKRVGARGSGSAATRSLVPRRR